MSKYIKCPECDGLGEITVVNEETEKVTLIICPECEGSGKVWDEEIPLENEK